MRTRGGAALVVAAMLAVGLPTAAEGKQFAEARTGPPDLHAIVASDGKIVERPVVVAKGSPPFEGSGETVPEAPSSGADDRAAPATPGVESIIGPDERVRVADTTTFPARAVVHILGGRGPLFLCTGWMIGPDTVATAGHCVYGGGKKGHFFGQFLVTPGKDGPLKPFGRCHGRKAFTVAGWAVNRDERYDYGAIKLDCDVGLDTGWFGFFWQQGSRDGEAAIVNGYPADLAPGQWQSFGSIVATTTQQLFYDNDTESGMSGAPVWDDRPEGSPLCVGACAFAIHAYGLHGAPPHSIGNHGARITRRVFQNLEAWRDAP